MVKGDMEMKVQPCAQPSDLLDAWRKKDLNEFKRVLKEGCDPNHIFEKGYGYVNILGIIAGEKDLAGKDFVGALEGNVDVNTVYMGGQSALHIAIQHGNVDVVEALIAAGANLVIRNMKGSYPLHYTLLEWNNSGSSKKIFGLLLKSISDEGLNCLDQQGRSPIFLAVKKKNREALLMLLEKGSLLDLDNVNGREGITAREAILAAYPELESDLNPNLGSSNVKMDASKLFSILSLYDEDRFCIAFEKEMMDKSQKSLLTETDGEYSMLQRACLNNMPKTVEILLKYGADPNYSKSDVNTPIKIAVLKGFDKVVSELLKREDIDLTRNLGNENPLHYLMKYCITEGHLHCLDLLLKHMQDKGSFDINEREVIEGNTALHLALLYSDEKAPLRLLEKGAYIGIVNDKGDTPLENMPVDIFEEFLNSKVFEKEKRQIGMNYSIYFNYDFLKPPGSNKKPKSDVETPLTNGSKDQIYKPRESDNYRESTPLLIMSRSKELRPLLGHPVLTSFTFLKWQRISRIFLINLCIYAIFCILLTGYIVYGYRSAPSIEPTPSNLIDDISFEKTGLHDKQNYTKPTQIEPLENTSIFILVIRVILLIFTFWLTIRELFQLIIRPRAYILSLGNWLEVSLIIMSIFIVIYDCPREMVGPFSYVCPQLCAIAVLIAWLTLLLSYGNHPTNAIEIEMFRTVSLSFTKFLSKYFVLILAFGLSFFVLFRGCTGDCKEDNPFLNSGTSLFKTVVMLTGEFEAGEIPFPSYTGTSHVIFLGFVFLVAIVLLNLLNGLAVADTRDIRDNAYLYTCIGRVKTVALLEEVFNGNILSFWPMDLLMDLIQGDSKHPCILSKPLNYFSLNVQLFPNPVTRGYIKVFPNNNNRIAFDEKLTNYFIYVDPMIDARKIISTKQIVKPESNDQAVCNAIASCSERLDTLDRKLAEFDKRFEHIEKLLIQNIAIVSLNNANNEDR